MKTSESLDKLAPALAKAQSEMGGASKDTENSFFKSKYADLASVWKACKEPLHNNGFSVVQSPKNTDDGRIGVSTLLLHSSGQFIMGEFTLGVKKANNPQEDGSSITYARRYSLAAMSGICQVDDDAEGAMNRAAAKMGKKLSEAEKRNIQANIDGWLAVWATDKKNGADKIAWWTEKKAGIIKDCGEDGAKSVHAAVNKK